MQRQFGGGVFSVPSSEEPADPQGTGEYQTAVFKVTTSDSLKVQNIFSLPSSLPLFLSQSHICPVFIRAFSDVTLRDICSQWRQHSLLLADSDFALVEPILSARFVAQDTLMTSVENVESRECISSVLTDHLMELCQAARKAGNTQVECVCVCGIKIRV